MLHQRLKADAVAFNRWFNEVGINSHEPLLRQIECGAVAARQVEPEHSKFNGAVLKIAFDGGRIGYHGAAGYVGVAFHERWHYLLKIRKAVRAYAYADLPPIAGDSAAYGFGQPVGVTQYLLAVVVENLPLGRDLPFPRCAQDECTAQFVFHFLKPEGKRRLADIEFLCSLAYLTFLHNGAEILHIFQIHSMPPCCASSR